MGDRREYSGNAVPTQLSAGMTGDSLSMTLTSVSGWPTGGVGKFRAVIDPDTASEEKVVCAARSGNTITISQRGADGTAAQIHSVNAVVEHVYTAEDAGQANRHLADPSIDDHSQYMHISQGRTVEADHVFSGDPSFTGNPNFQGVTTFSGSSYFDGTGRFQDMGADSDYSTIGGKQSKRNDDDRPASLKHTHKVDRVALEKELIPVGVTRFSFNPTASDGWGDVDGGEISRTENPAAFTLWGTKYGAGNGSTTFNKPKATDLMISVAASASKIGEVTGADTATLTATMIPKHQHPITDVLHHHNIDGDGGLRVIVTSGPSTLWLGGSATPQHTQEVSISDIDSAYSGINHTEDWGGKTGGGVDTVPTRPKNMALRFEVKIH